MPVTLSLKKMNRVEKLRAMKALWADLPQDEEKLASPPWHEAALRDAERRVSEGSVTFADWEAAKVRIRHKAAKIA